MMVWWLNCPSQKHSLSIMIPLHHLIMYLVLLINDKDNGYDQMLFP